MATFGDVTIEIGGEKHVVNLKRIDLVRVEQALQTSITKLEGMTSQFAFAWAAARRMKIDGIPDTFDAFLDLNPDVEDVQDGDGDEGKASGQDQTTGSSSNSPSKRASRTSSIST